MTGSGTLILPVIFDKVGIINCLLVMLIICGINFYTSKLLLIHGKEGETDLNQIIQRLLGKRASQLFVLASSSLLFFASAVYYLIQCNMIYGVLAFICQKLDYDLALKSEITFN